jgi:hypothetical protein
MTIYLTKEKSLCCRKINRCEEESIQIYRTPPVKSLVQEQQEATGANKKAHPIS